MRSLKHERGIAMAALLVGMSIMALLLTMAMPAWRTMAQREKEAELFFRGQQYARAVAKYQSVRGTYPPSVDVLVTEKFLRKKYKDPMTDEDFEVVRVGQVTPGQVQGRAGQPGQAGQPQSGFRPIVTAGIGAAGGAPILGVVSKSTAAALRIVDGKTRYNEMTFVASQATTQAGTVNGSTTVGGVAGTNRPGGGTDVNRGRSGTPTPGAGGGLRLGPTGGGGRGQSPPGR